jgi:putative transposase
MPAIREIVAENPAWGVRKVWATLRRRGLCASRKRVWALMKSEGLTLEPSATREAPERYGHVSVPESNRRWGSDLTTAWTKQDGTVAIVPVMDYGDRFAFRCQVTKSQESVDVLAPTETALLDVFGAPRRLPDGFEWRTDHGPQFTGADCEALCEEWGIDHTFSPVGRPTGNAVVERFIGTLKTELIWTRDWESMEELQSAIDEWLRKYNFERPHQALGWMTPAEKRAENVGRRLQTAA